MSKSTKGGRNDEDAREIEERLFAIFGSVNEWVKFAEAKNGALVVLGGVGITAIATYLATASQPRPLVLVGFLVGGFFLSISLVIALISFIPQQDLPKTLQRQVRQEPSAGDNLYFYGDLQKYSAEQLVEKIASRYMGLEHFTVSSCQSCFDLAAQIIVNSRIATTKFQYAKRATLVALLGGLVVIVIFGAALIRAIAAAC